jgi:hypothetical protein
MTKIHINETEGKKILWKIIIYIFPTETAVMEWWNISEQQSCENCVNFEKIVEKIITFLIHSGKKNILKQRGSMK